MEKQTGPVYQNPIPTRQQRRAHGREQAVEQENQDKFIALMRRAERLRALKAGKQTFNTMAKNEFTREQ